MVEHLKSAQRVVIKIGSALLVNEDRGELKRAWLESVCQDIAELKDRGEVLARMGSAELTAKEVLNAVYPDLAPAPGNEVGRALKRLLHADHRIRVLGTE